MVAQSALKLAVLAAMVSGVACAKFRATEKVTASATGPHKPQMTNLHKDSECPPMIDGAWITNEGQKLTVARDIKTNQLSISFEADGGTEIVVDGLVHTAKGQTTLGSCSGNILYYSYTNADRSVDMKITTINSFAGKIDATTVALGAKGKVSQAATASYVLSRPSFAAAPTPEP